MAVLDQKRFFLPRDDCPSLYNGVSSFHLLEEARNSFCCSVSQTTCSSRPWMSLPSPVTPSSLRADLWYMDVNLA